MHTALTHTHFHEYPLFSPHLGAVWKYLDTPHIFFGNEVEKMLIKTEKNKTIQNKNKPELGDLCPIN